MTRRILRQLSRWFVTGRLLRRPGPASPNLGTSSLFSRTPCCPRTYCDAAVHRHPLERFFLQAAAAHACGPISNFLWPFEHRQSCPSSTGVVHVVWPSFVHVHADDERVLSWRSLEPFRFAAANRFRCKRILLGLHGLRDQSHRRF